MPKEHKWKGVNQTSNNCWVLVICYSTFSQANSLQSLKDTRGKTGARRLFRQGTAFFTRIIRNKHLKNIMIRSSLFLRKVCRLFFFQKPGERFLRRICCCPRGSRPRPDSPAHPSVTCGHQHQLLPQDSLSIRKKSPKFDQFSSPLSLGCSSPVYGLSIFWD